MAETEFPGAIDRILDPTVFDCNLVPENAPCTYSSANRPSDLPIQFIGIHDIEGSGQIALNIFQNPHSSVSAHYIVDFDGTIYQVLQEKDISFSLGNFWYNERAINIEHAGFDATGFLWYNTAQYLASAKLVAYLATKYDIPIDRDHIIGHGMVPSPNLAVSPNHVDPGPYWLWDFYLNLIKAQNPLPIKPQPNARIVSIHPLTGMLPLGLGGTETAANFNFFYLYNGPSTQSGLIPPHAAATDITSETTNVEVGISYYFLDQVVDPAGTGFTMYQIWYGAQLNLSASPPDKLAHGILAWLAVPLGAARIGSSGTVLELKTSGSDVVK